MSLAPSVPSDPPSTRRRVSKATNPRPPEKQKVAVYLSPETARRLGVASVMESRSQSEIVDQLLASALKRWVVSDRAKSADQATTVEESADDAD